VALAGSVVDRSTDYRQRLGQARPGCCAHPRRPGR